MDIHKFKKLPLMGILRGIELGVVEPLVEAIVDSGLKTIEITMNTKDAEDIIRRAVEAAKKRLTIGAGTVLGMESLKRALQAGASFIVMPVLHRDVTAYCVKNKIPSFPGALTPQEIYDAWQAGATMVKVFPARVFGPDYFKEIKGPFNDIELLACGGVRPENLKEYFANGASAASFGDSVFKKEWLSAGDYSRISESIRQFIRQL
ncbi:MAG: bifunctional 4-hydroxy-2-oxoglutarate aldolase/2-dehydro-3-deoxy-phosphogluconate aldolase [Candidatus Omnitrophica bacterium]|nr:bifunctional 4-hydroxy-2-oxoglutarate aldolase/2-dehydro-3-deoxy-phosphogluconate aldolase [Candidatus Omnitrophota bacterium]